MIDFADFVHKNSCNPHLPVSSSSCLTFSSSIFSTTALSLDLSFIFHFLLLTRATFTMEMIYYNDELIEYATITQDFDQIMRECSSVEKQYQLQIRLQDCLLQRQAVNDKQLEFLYAYIQSNRAWTHCMDEATYLAEWQEVTRAAERSRKKKTKFQKAKQRVIERWTGPLRIEWVQNHEIKYAVTIFSIFFPKYNEEKIKSRLVPVIIEKIWRDTSSGKNINCKLIPKDFERVNKGDVVTLVMLEDLEEFYLCIDKDGVLRPNDSHSQVRTLPLSLPPPPFNPKKSYGEGAGLLSNQAYSSFTPINQPEFLLVSSSAPISSCVPAPSATLTSVARASFVSAGFTPTFDAPFSEFLSSATLLLISADSDWPFLPPSTVENKIEPPFPSVSLYHSASSHHPASPHPSASPKTDSAPKFIDLTNKPADFTELDWKILGKSTSDLSSESSLKTASPS